MAVKWFEKTLESNRISKKRECSIFIIFSFIKSFLIISLIIEGVYANRYESNGTFNCKDEGYFSDSQNCQVYYRCVKWNYQNKLTLFKFECGPGTVFSHSEGDICVYPRISERPECSELSLNNLDASTFPQFNRSEEFNKITTTKQMKNEQSLNFHTDIFNRPSTPQTPAPLILNEVYNSLSTESINTEEPINNSLNENNNREPFSCHEEGFFADPKDCKKFYRCVGNEKASYTKYVFACGDGTIWDSEIQACNHEWAINHTYCQSFSTNDENTNNQNNDSDNNTQSEISENQIDNTTNNSYLPPFQSSTPNLNLNNNLLPFTNISSVSSSTSTVLITDNKFPSSTTTTQKPISEPNKLSTSKTEEKSTTLNPLNNDNNNNDDDDNNIESEPSLSVCTEEGFFSDSNDCQKFYRCVQTDSSWVKYDFKCADGTAWDQNIQSCNFLYAVPQCTKNNSSPDNNNSNEVEGTNTIHNIFTENKFTNMSSSVKPTYLPPPYFENKTSSSLSSSSLNTPTTVGPTILPTSSINIFENTTEYNTESQETELNSIDNFKKNFSMITQSPSTIMSMASEKPFTSLSMIKTTTPSTKPSTTSTNISLNESVVTPNLNFTMQCQEEGFFPDLEKCEKFYRCVKVANGYMKYSFTCGLGTGWDQSISACNYLSQISSCNLSTNSINNIPNNAMESNEINEITNPISQPTIEKNPDKIPEYSNLTTTEKISNNNLNSNTNKLNFSLPTTELTIPTTSSTTKLQSPQMNSNKNEGIICERARFYPNPSNCNKFYQCVDNGNGFNIYHFDCPPGTIFDPSIDVCNYPESVYPQRNCSKLNNESSNTSSTLSTLNTDSDTNQNEESTKTTSTDVSTNSITTNTFTVIDENSGNDITDESNKIDEGITGTTVIGSTEKLTVSTEFSNTETTDVTETPVVPTEETIVTTLMDKTMTSTQIYEESTTLEMNKVTEASQTTLNENKITAVPIFDNDSELIQTPCPIGNLTDEQIVLICPTGFKRHPKYCNMFYQCQMEGNMEIKIIILGCPENTIFDEKKIQCLRENESSQVCNTEKASARLYRELEQSSVAPIKVSNTALCPREGHFPFSQGCNNVFYKCKIDSRQLLKGYLYQCPKDFVYWSVSRRCEQKSRLPVCNNYKNAPKISFLENKSKLLMENDNTSA